MILQLERQLLRMGLVRRPPLMGSWTRKFYVVLHQHPIVQHGYARRMKHVLVGAKPGSVENDVVCLPFSGRPGGIDQRRILPVNRRRLAIGIGSVLVRIKHLNLVQPHQEHAAITAILAFTGRGQRFGELDMQLTIAEGIAGRDVARTRDDLHIAVAHLPFCRPTIRTHPLRKIFAVK